MGWDLKQGDLRPNLSRAKDDLDTAIEYSAANAEQNDPTQNRNMGPGGGPGPTIGARMRQEMSGGEDNGLIGKASGGCVTARGQATMAKLRARHGKDV